MTAPTNSGDWHPADVMAALRKTPERWTLRALSLASGYSEGAVGRAIRDTAWPAVERVIADALGLEPWDIWPSRYHADGTPKKGVPADEVLARRPGRHSTSSRSEAA